jgi:hypothetical protein
MDRVDESMDFNKRVRKGPNGKHLTTLVPRRAYTLPSSRPMTPPPMTIIVSGIFSKLSAPVESTMLLLSTSMPGSLAGT